MTFLVLAALSGCTAGHRAELIARNPSFPTRILVEGDWNDLDAAVVVAASQTETVVLGRSRPSPDERTFEVCSIRDEPVQVTARRAGPAPSGSGPVAIELTCAYGIVGDGLEQDRFLHAMARRLGDLRGADYRKVR